MGWWHINKIGGISSVPPTGSREEAPVGNAIPGRDSTEDHYGGDIPADYMQDALDKITAEWKRTWGREPYIEELDGVWQFCTYIRRKAAEAGGGDDGITTKRNC